MARTPTGTITSVATAFAPVKTTTGITNAAEGVVSSTAHGLANGDIVEITSGWGRLNKRAFRVKAVTADAFTLEGANTTNTEFYPSGSGGGSARAIARYRAHDSGFLDRQLRQHSHQYISAGSDWYGGALRDCRCDVAPAGVG